MSTASFQHRLNVIERQIGIDVLQQQNAIETSDLVRRLDSLENQIFVKLQSHQLQETLDESDALMKEIDPGTALTYQTDISAPLVYRKQTVLAAAPDFHKDLDQMAEILSLLSIGQTMDQKTKSLSAEKISNAPILGVQVTDEQQERLDKCIQQCVDLQRQADASTRSLDSILDQYQRLVAAASEKLLVLDEGLAQLELKKLG